MNDEKNSSNEQIKYGSIISYILLFLNIVLGLLYTPWILKEIGDSHYGIYTLASSLIALFLLDFGMSSAVSRFVAMYRADGQQDMVNNFVGIAFKLYFFIMAAITVVLFCVYLNLDIIYSNLTLEEFRVFNVVFVITAVCVIVCFPVNICNGILNAYEEYIALKTSEIFNKLGTVVATIVVLLLHGGVYGLVAVNGIFNIVTFVIKFYCICKRTPVKINFKYFSITEFHGIFSFQAWTTIASLSQQMVFNLVPTILAMVSNTFAITSFGFVNIIEGYVYTITNAINGLFLPKVMRILTKSQDASNTLSLMIKVGRINQSIISLLLIGLISVGQQFIDLWIGDEFQILHICIVLVCSSYFISASQQIANTSLTALNQIKYQAIINVITGIINLVFVYLLGGKFGIIGVSFTIGFIYWLRVILLNIVYIKILHINIFQFFKECQLKMLPAILICLAVSYAVGKFLPINLIGINGWFIFMMKVLLICLIFFICMWLLGWNCFEKQLILSFFHFKNKFLKQDK